MAHVEKGLAAAGDIRLEGGRVALRDHDPFTALLPAALARVEAIEAAFRAGGMTPPDSGGLGTPDPHQVPDDPALIALLVASGRLVSLRNVALRQTLTFHAAALDDAVDTLRSAFPPPSEFTTGEARARLATSRKFIVPALEFFDARGDTLRRGDVRQVAGVEDRSGEPASTSP
jgi:selenocysteine-specific elongation factor